MRKSAYLITEEMFREVSPLPGTFDWNYLKPHILRAQDIHLQPLLGSKLFYDLQVKLYDDTLTADDAELLDDYIAKALVYSVLADPYCFNVKVENSGIVTKDLGDSRSITFEDAKKLSEQMRSHADFYKQRLIDYLQANTAKFPLYLVAEAPDMPANGDALPDFMNFDTGYKGTPAASSGGGGTGGTTEHDKLTAESRGLANQHPIGAITLLREELDALQSDIDQEVINRDADTALLRQDLATETQNRQAAEVTLSNAITAETQARIDGDIAVSADSIARDTSLQNQIFAMQENNPVSQTRYLTRDQIVLNAETLYQSKAEKDNNPAFEITASITATTAETANLVASWVGIALVNELELIDQITQLFIKARKNTTNRNVVMFARFFDRTSAGVKTLKGTSSQVVLTDTTTSYDLYFPIQAYLAAVGSRGQIDILGFQTGTGTAAQIATVIEGDYYSRWSYTIPAGALSFLDEKVISTQDLPSLNLLAGATQKDVNGAQNELNIEVERGIAFNGNDVILCRDYYSASTSITAITARGASLVERSTDNISFVTATPPFTVTGDIYWRITHSEENAFLKIKGKLI